ncbi:MAG TPA: Rrf2 family transcriptional regulator [Vicinamibacteria bacterium]|nr:Rrf2 family transcriptional regulator [Vicinamibacteria bacterium]
MKFSSQEEYGLRCLVQLARSAPKSLTIAELAQAQGITVPNVGKILRVLRTGGLVKSTRGQAGGYTLSRAPEEISIRQALAVLGERIFDSSFCDRHAGIEALCLNMGDCSIRPVLRQVQDAIDQVLSQLTLKSLVASEREVAVVAVSPRAVLLPVARN